MISPTSGVIRRKLLNWPAAQMQARKPKSCSTAPYSTTVTTLLSVSAGCTVAGAMLASPQTTTNFT